MGNNKKSSDTFHYILTFISIVLLVGCFATHIFTGKDAILIMDSLSGSFLIGVILAFYLIWFIYDTSTTKDIPLSRAAKSLLKSSAVAYCIYAYWVVFMIIPSVIRIL